MTAAKLSTGRRKEAIARVRLVPGRGLHDQRPLLDEYLPTRVHRMVATAPLRSAGRERDYDVIVSIRGGGVSGQAGAVRLGVARALHRARSRAPRPAEGGGLPDARRAREGAPEVRPQEGPQGAAVLEALASAFVLRRVTSANASSQLARRRRRTRSPRARRVRPPAAQPGRTGRRDRPGTAPHRRPSSARCIPSASSRPRIISPSNGSPVAHTRTRSLTSSILARPARCVVWSRRRRPLSCVPMARLFGTDGVRGLAGSELTRRPGPSARHGGRRGAGRRPRRSTSDLRRRTRHAELRGVARGRARRRHPCARAATWSSRASSRRPPSRS